MSQGIQELRGLSRLLEQRVQRQQSPRSLVSGSESQPITVKTKGLLVCNPVEGSFLPTVTAPSGERADLGGKGKAMLLEEQGLGRCSRAPPQQHRSSEQPLGSNWPACRATASCAEPRLQLSRPLCWSGLFWDAGPFVSSLCFVSPLTSVPVSNPDKIHPFATWILVQLLLWSVVGSLSGVSS